MLGYSLSAAPNTSTCVWPRYQGGGRDSVYIDAESQLVVDSHSESHYVTEYVTVYLCMSDCVTLCVTVRHTVTTAQAHSVRVRAESQLVDSHSVLNPKLGQRTQSSGNTAINFRLHLLYYCILCYWFFVFLYFCILDLLGAFVSNQWLSWPPANKFHTLFSVYPL